VKKFRDLFQPKALVRAPLSQIAELFAEATDAYRSKDFSRAIALCDRIIALEPGHAEAHYKRGNALKDLGQFAAALASYDEAIKRRPDFAHAWCNRGVMQQALGLYEAALTSYDQAITLDPTDALVHSNRGSLLQAISRSELALVSYDQALGLNPQLFQTWFNRGNVLRELQRPDAALASFREAVKLKPDSAEAHYNCGVLLERTQQPRAALASYNQAIAVHPGFYQAHYNLAGVLKELREREAALVEYGRAIAAKGDYAEAHANRGVVLQELGRREEALASYDRAISIRPDHAEAYFNRGTLLAELMQWEAALANYDHAIALKPGYAAAYCERARVLVQVRRLDEALLSYNEATAIQPEFAEAQYNKSLALLLRGDYENGWLQYEWRWKNADRLSMGEARIFGQPRWRGKEIIAGKRLFVYSEQGFGDTLQFCRFAKTVADMGATVILEVQAPLATLLGSLDGASRVIVEGSPLPEFDYQCPLLSLPLALNTTIDTIPAAPYVRSDEAKVARWRTRMRKLGRPRIGLTWSGNPKQGHYNSRSTRLADWIKHLPLEFQYVSLQKEIRPADVEILAATPWISRFDAEWHDFSDAAALCECVDLVVSVCTSIAHLSGALGKPTWVLLPFIPDWRWLLDRDDSPWYPTVKLYRQQAIGDWNGVFERMGADLRKAAADGDFRR
jgi:tetratricopeptide (TPR) repeat protein